MTHDPIKVRLLYDAVRSWRRSSNELPGRVKNMRHFALRIAEAPELEPSCSSTTRQRIQGLAQEIIDLLGPVTEGDTWTVEQLRGMRERIAPWLLEVRSLPEAIKKGSLYAAAHAYLENTLWLLENLNDSIRERWVGLEPAVGLPPETMGAEFLQEVAGRLESLIADSPPDSAQVRPRTEELRAGHVHVCIVEDDPLWQDQIVGVLQRIASDLPNQDALTWQVLEHYQESLDYFRGLSSDPRKSGRVGGGRERDDFLAIAVLDLGIPADAVELARVRAGNSTPDHSLGRKLLEEARSYAINLPTIVLTTPKNFLLERRHAHSLGVQDYLFKNRDSLTRLEIRLKAVLRTPRTREVRILEETGRRVLVDGVPIDLDPIHFRTFAVLVGSGRALTTEQVVDALDEKFGDVFPYRASSEQALQDARALAAQRGWAADHARFQEVVNLILYWASGRNQQLTPHQIVETLRTHIRSWRTVEHLARAAEISSHDVGALAPYLDRTVGGLTGSGPDYSPDLIHDHVYNIWKSIQHAFNQVGQAIWPQEEVLASTRVGPDFGYKVVARRMLPEASPPRPALCTVLVVEDDPAWQERIASLLQMYGYVVHCEGSVQGATEALLTIPADLLCLDLQLPETPDQLELNPGSGDPRAGLTVLGGCRRDVRTVILSDYADLDILRQEAEELGVRVDDVVSKANSDWEGQLVLSLWRLEQELLQGGCLPFPDLSTVPYLEFTAASRLVKVNGELCGLTQNEDKFLRTLCYTPNLPVPVEVLDEEVYGDIVDGNCRRLLVRRLREKLRKWLGLGDGPDGRRASQRILEEAAGTYLIRARVALEGEEQGG